MGFVISLSGVFDYVYILLMLGNVLCIDSTWALLVWGIMYSVGWDVAIMCSR